MYPIRTESAGPSLGMPLVTGVLLVLLFFGSFVAWAVTAPLNGAAIAQGELSVESKRKEIAHLEGGIIQSIDIREGDTVDAGQILVRFDRTQSEANLELIRGRYHAAIALEARLLAERDRKNDIQFPDWLRSLESDDKVFEMLNGEENIFRKRREALIERQDILRTRIGQYKAEISGLLKEIQSQTKHLALLQEEVASHEILLAKGLIGRPRSLELKREAAETEGAKSRNQAAVARVKQNIAESQLEINRVETEYLNEVVQTLRETQTEIFDLSEKLRSAQDVMDRTDVRSPIHGTVVNLQIHTVGGVVGPGQKLLDIVPANETLVIEAKVKPEDIDVVQPGLDAHVRFTAFSSSSHDPLPAKVARVSADRLLDERTGEAFYNAKLILTEHVPTELNGDDLYPGMQAEVMIVTHSRTAFDYLLEPLLRRVNRAFRES